MDRLEIDHLVAASRATVGLTVLLATLAAGWACPRPACAAGSIRVAVTAIDGRGGGRGAIKNFQRALKRLPGLRIQTTKGFYAEARAQGVERRLPEDSGAISSVAVTLGVDAVIYGRVAKPKHRPRKRSRRRDRVLHLTVYNGGDGSVIGQHDVRVPKGKLTKQLWRRAARTVAKDLRQGTREPAFTIAAPPEPVVDERFDRLEGTDGRDRYSPEPVPAHDQNMRIGDDRDDDPPTGDAEIIRVRAGAILLSRSFDYQVTDESMPFRDGGIQYATTLAPGVAVEADLFPAAIFTGGAASDFGLRLSFHKAFLQTKQTVSRSDGTDETRDLETHHSHLRTGLLYRHRFGDDEAAPEIAGGVGLGFLTFELQGNGEYDGASYTYIDTVVGGEIPLGTRYAIADLSARLLPWASLGDTTTELGESASIIGWGIAVGLSSRWGAGLSSHIGLDYTALSADVSGTGRDERQGKTASDAYTTLKAMVEGRF